MKATKREACKKALLEAGSLGVLRKTFEADRVRFGTSFIRRLQELEEEYEMEKLNELNLPAGKHDFISRWIIGDPKPRQEAMKLSGKNEVFIGSALGWDFYEQTSFQT